MQPSSACISPKGSIGPLKTQCYWPCPYNSLYCSLSAVNIPGYHPIPTISICHYPPCPYNQYFFMAGLVKCQLGLSLFTIPPLRQDCTHYAPHPHVNYSVFKKCQYIPKIGKICLPREYSCHQFCKRVYSRYDVCAIAASAEFYESAANMQVTTFLLLHQNLKHCCQPCLSSPSLDNSPQSILNCSISIQAALTPKSLPLHCVKGRASGKCSSGGIPMLTPC